MSRLSAFVQRIVVCVPLTAIGTAIASAQDAPQVEVVAPELSRGEIDKLVAQLDAEEFTAREAATKSLIAGGAAVVPAVEKGADSDNLEIATRCLAILKGLYEGKDVDAQADAAIALKRLCDSPNAAIARRAAAIIDPPQPAAPPVGLPPGVRINMRGFPQGAGARQMQVVNQNGQTHVTVQEGERKIQISHRAGADITVEVTEPPVAGKPAETKKYTAKDGDELKKKHPDAFKLYEDYGSQGGADIFAGNFPPGVFPPGVVPQMRRRQAPRVFRNFAPNPGKAAADLEAVQRQLERLAGRLNELAETKEMKPEELKRLADDVSRIQKEVSETAKSVEE